MSTQTITSKKTKQVKYFEWEEIKKHNTNDSCWIVLNGDIYDVTTYAAKHPGGQVILTQGGRDATCVFRSYHPDNIFNNPNHFVRRIGKVKDYNISKMDQQYMDFYYEMEKKGFFKSSALYYIIKYLIVYALLIGGIYFSVTADTWIKCVFGALFAGFAQHQVAFVSHDIMHTQVFQNLNWDFLTGIVLGGPIFGVSAIWWKYTHNQHHVVTNEYDRDPDITHIPIFSVNVFSYLGKKGYKMNILEKLFLYLSPILFLPIVGFLARFSMYLQGILMFFILGYVPAMKWQPIHYSKFWITAEMISLILFFTWYGSTMYFIPNNLYRTVFFIITHIITGMLHIQLTLSHYDRPNIHSEDRLIENDKANISFFEQQIITGRNIDSTFMNDWFYGGLHYQIEHHLFPRAPRHHLDNIKQHLLPLCKKYNIYYCTGGFLNAFYNVMKTVYSSSRTALQKPITEHKNIPWLTGQESLNYLKKEL